MSDYLINPFKVSAGACTDVLAEPFNNLSAWTNVGGTIVAGRTGTAASFTGSTNIATYTIAAASESDTITVGCAFKVANLGTNRVVGSLRSDTAATQHSVINVTATGAVSITGASTVSSAAGVITINTWYYLELQVKLHDTTGFVIVRVNGTEVANTTGTDTKLGGTKTTYDSIRVGPGGSSHTLLVDDLYLSTGTGCSFKGDHTIP